MRPLLAIQRLNSATRQHILYPAKRWLTLQHFVAIIFLLMGLSLLSNPSAPYTELAKLPLFENSIPALAGLFLFASAFLFFHPVSEVGFRLSLLPLYLSLGVLVWFRLTGQTDSWAGVLFTVTIIGFLWIARVDVPPKGGDRDHT